MRTRERPPSQTVGKGNFMETVCFVPGGICFLSVFVNITLAFVVMAPFAATRLLVLRMREHSVGHLQHA